MNFNKRLINYFKAKKIRKELESYNDKYISLVDYDWEKQGYSKEVGCYEKQIIPVEAMQVKLNFANFVRRFERENTNILEFGTLIPYDKKISIIADKLREYAKEVTPIKQNQNEN